VVVEAGYDRSIPFGDPTPAELIPTIDPVTFAIEFANGVVQGANNAFELVGTQLPDYPQLESLLDQAQAWSIQDIGDILNPILGLLGTVGGIFTS
jgi:hypothetical protein